MLFRLGKDIHRSLFRRREERLLQVREAGRRREELESILSGRSY